MRKHFHWFGSIVAKTKKKNEKTRRAGLKHMATTDTCPDCVGWRFYTPPSPPFSLCCNLIPERGPRRERIGACWHSRFLFPRKAQEGGCETPCHSPVFDSALKASLLKGGDSTCPQICQITSAQGVFREVCRAPCEARARVGASARVLAGGEEVTV